MKFTTTAAILALAASANAQFSIAGLSSGCTGAFASFIIGELSSCLQVTSLLPVLNASGNNSAIDPLNRYLTSLCGSGTPICSNQSLAGAVTNVKGGCAAELEDKASIPSVILTVLEHYGPIRTAACSKNSTNNAFCVSDALTTIQNDTDTNVSFDTVTALLGGDNSTEEKLVQAFGTGNLCTGCVAEIYNAAVQVNASVADSSIGQTVAAQCGANFGQNSTGVQAPSATSAAAGASGTAAPASGGAVSRAGWMVGAGSVAAVVVGAVVAL